MLYLPFNDPEATYEMAREFAGRPGVLGFMVTATRNRGVHHDAYMKTYAFLEEAGLPLGFHASYNWNDQTMAMMNKFISVHALGFAISNMVHLTNWIMNGLPERFPRLKVIWIESGLAWISFLMHRLDHRSEEHTSELQSLMRISYAVFCLKKKKKNNDTTLITNQLRQQQQYQRIILQQIH